MNNNQFELPPPPILDEEKPKDLREIFYTYGYHWPLFVLSMVICLAVAYVYVGYVKPTYHVKAKLTIKDDKKSAVSNLALEELNVTSGPKQIESEIEILKSRPLIGQVIDELQLWSNYSITENYVTTDLWAKTPVKLELIEPAGHIKKRNYLITIESKDAFMLTKANGEILRASFSDHFNSDFGVWKLNPTTDLESFIGKTITIHLQDPTSIVNRYQSGIVAILNKVAPIIDMSIDDQVPERGTAILNHLIAAYKNYNIIDKNKETQNTLKFIDERLASLAGELTHVEKDVEGYKSSIGLTDISSKSQYYLTNVQLNDGRLNEVDIQLNVIEGIEDYVNNAEKSGNAPATIGITDPGLVSLVEQLSRLQIQRDKLLAITPEGNPIFTPLNKQINSTKTSIKETVKGIKSSLLATKRQLDKNNNKFESSIKNIPGQERKYVSIKRQQGIKESLYVYLLQKREEVALSYASTITDARTIEEAYFEEPQSEKGFPFAMALLIGTLFPTALIYTRNAVRNRVLTRTDIEIMTNAPIICELANAEKNATLVVLDGERFALGEQLRVLRTNLLYENTRQQRGKVTLFTSSIAGEGKSFVASNVGASLAASGKKTVILELDLRKPKISKIFNLEITETGLSSFLAGRVSKEELIMPSNIHPNLFVIKSGGIPANPSELLEGQEMRWLIDQLRDEFDNILIDSPPLHLVTDALILAPLCDVCLYMVRHNFTPKSELRFIDEIYRSRRLPTMNLVFNGVEMDKRYGYSVDYGYYSKKSPQNSIWHTLFGNFFARF